LKKKKYLKKKRFLFYWQKKNFSNMPAQLSTILYVSEYKEKTSSGYIIVNCIGYTRLEEEGDRVQKYNMTAFYPIDESKPCYLPQMMEGQVLSISNTKFNKGVNGELEVS